MMTSIPLFLTLYLLLLATRVMSQVTESSHMCAKVMSGDFPKLQLQSVFFWRKSNLVFQDHKQRYYVDSADITDHSVTIGDVEKVDSAEEMIRQVEDGPETIPVAGFVLDGGMHMLFKNKTNEIWVKTHESKDGQYEKLPLPRRDQDFNILSDGSSTGYFIVTENPFTKSQHNFGLYNMKCARCSIENPSPDKTSVTNSTELFYLERTSSSSKVALIPRTSIPSYEYVDDARKMMTLLPVGYMRQGSIYLFDHQRGCVYVVADMASNSPLNPQRTFVKKRTNIPFEQFFKCDKAKYPYTSKRNPDRCAHSMPAKKTKPLKKGSGKIKWIIICIGACMFVGLCLLVASALASVLSYHKKGIQTDDTDKDGSLKDITKSKLTSTINYKSARSAVSESGRIDQRGRQVTGGMSMGVKKAAKQLRSALQSTSTATDTISIASLTKPAIQKIVSLKRAKSVAKPQATRKRLKSTKSQSSTDTSVGIANTTAIRKKKSARKT